MKSGAELWYPPSSKPLTLSKPMSELSQSTKPSSHPWESPWISRKSYKLQIIGFSSVFQRLLRVHASNSWAPKGAVAGGWIGRTLSLVPIPALNRRALTELLYLRGFLLRVNLEQIKGVLGFKTVWQALVKVVVELLDWDWASLTAALTSSSEEP